MHVDHAPRTHVPHLERNAYNQMPKDRSWTDLKLYNFDGTDLYQWFGRKWKAHFPDSREGFYSSFQDQATEVFRMRKHYGAAMSLETRGPKADAERAREALFLDMQLNPELYYG